jgi:hypothetical protein
MNVLIKLTGVPHPDLNGGKPQPIYIDASRVLLIIQGHQRYPKIEAVERGRELLDQLWRLSADLARRANEYIPDFTDPVAMEWVKKIATAAMAVNDAYGSWAKSYQQGDYHPMVECTEVQLACGTALEHGVMLTRVWVSESPDEVAVLVRRAVFAGNPLAYRESSHP